MNNIEVFNDKQMRIQSNEELKRKTAGSVEKTTVYDEGFFSGVIPCYADTAVTVEENLTLLSAKKFVDQGKKTAILNFANPIEPGGGVLRGAKAFKNVLEIPRYKKAFTDITFAIKRTFSRCKNLEAFERIINQGEKYE